MKRIGVEGKSKDAVCRFTDFSLGFGPRRVIPRRGNTDPVRIENSGRAYNPNIAPPQASTEGLFQQTRLIATHNQVLILQIRAAHIASMQHRTLDEQLELFQDPGSCLLRPGYL